MEPNVSAQAAWNDWEAEEPSNADENTIHQNLPKRAVKILFKWLKRNYFYPYPDDLAKAEMMEYTSLTISQIEDWFIHARRMILPKIAEKKRCSRSRIKGGKKFMPAHIVTGTTSADALPSTSTVAPLPMRFPVSSAPLALLQVRSPPEVQSLLPKVQSQPPTTETPSKHCDDSMRRFQILLQVASWFKEELDAEEAKEALHQKSWDRTS
ncbi:homeobox protein TGIF2LX-like [Pelobates fuscus]|uniref:homeobox protein TGIF2LX-like n=1 Tax=Pelobates fuscus TaxID=191477 RepID=UPI002FE4C0E4